MYKSIVMKRISHVLPAVLFAGIFLFSRCDSTTKFTSNPPNAHVLVNEKYIGKTPIKYKRTVSNSTVFNVRISHPEYEKIDTSFVKEGNINLANRIFGYLFIFPLEFDRNFKKQYHFVLRPKTRSDEQPENLKEEIPGQQETTKAQKLRQLLKDYNEGKISRLEFEAQKKIILNN